ncbi:hypothetical protein ACF5W4_11300 [Bacillota bacterium Lsc_1132]
MTKKFLAFFVLLFTSFLGLFRKKRRPARKPSSRLSSFPARVRPSIVPSPPTVQKLQPVINIYPAAVSVPAIDFRKPADDLKEMFQVWKRNMEEYDALRQRLTG